MEKYKDILRFYFSGVSQRKISEMLAISRNTVSKVVNAAKGQNVTWDILSSCSEHEIREKLFPKKDEEVFYNQPDFEEYAFELRKKGVTKKLLWEEYVTLSYAENKIPLQYSQFCLRLNQFLEQSKATMILQHHPGEKVEVDWAGQTLSMVNDETGELIKGYLFVATLPFSQYSYAEVTLDMKQETWIQAHVNLFNYLGGVPSMIVCDNLKTGVIKHPRNGEIILNDAYRELADYYHTAIIPAKPRTPKGKASVEATVGKLTTQIIAKCRNMVFESIHHANQTIFPLLQTFNQTPFQKKFGSRESIFHAQEEQLLHPLPTEPYAFGNWKRATVQYHYHISVEKMFYSVPFQYIKQQVDVRITHQLIEVFSNHQRICSHRRLYGHPGQYSTKEDHMPPKHQKANEWDKNRFIRWANQIGEGTTEVITQLFAHSRYEQQGYNGCRSILKLEDSFTPHELEAACLKALKILSSPRYSHIKRIIASNQLKKDMSPSIDVEDSNNHAFIRGSQYFGGDL